MKSDLYNELRYRRQDRVMRRALVLLTIIFVLGLALAAYYQIKLIA